MRPRVAARSLMSGASRPARLAAGCKRHDGPRRTAAGKPALHRGRGMDAGAGGVSRGLHRLLTPEPVAGIACEEREIQPRLYAAPNVGASDRAPQGYDSRNSLLATASRKPGSASLALHWRPCLLLWWSSSCRRSRLLCGHWRNTFHSSVSLDKSTCSHLLAISRCCHRATPCL
jgi:hypothetical protein